MKKKLEFTVYYTISLTSISHKYNNHYEGGAYNTGNPGGGVLGLVKRSCNSGGGVEYV